MKNVVYLRYIHTHFCLPFAQICIKFQESIHLFAHIKRTHSNTNKLRNKSTGAKILHSKRIAIEELPSRTLKVITIADIR